MGLSACIDSPRGYLSVVIDGGCGHNGPTRAAGVGHRVDVHHSVLAIGDETVIRIAAGHRGFAHDGSMAVDGKRPAVGASERAQIMHLSIPIKSMFYRIARQEA